MDFNTAEPQREFSLIPHGTICAVHLTVRPGNVGEGGLLRRSKDGASEGLDCEFAVVNGEYAKQKFWAISRQPERPTDTSLPVRSAPRSCARSLRARAGSRRTTKARPL